MDFSSSDDSDSSIWSSEDEEERRPANPKEMLAGYFSEPPTTNAMNLEPKMRLRKQETAYANTSSPSSVLAPHALPRHCASLDEAFAAPLDHDRETTGFLVDQHGTPIAAIRETRPPPPNTNRQGQSHQHSLRRALGYDPHYHPRKQETKGIVNKGESIHKDAGLSDDRRAQTKSLATRGDAFHNKSHTQGFSELDTNRSTYDGFNVSPKVKALAARRAPLEHTWRTTHGSDVRNPVSGHKEEHQTKFHGVRETQRREVSDLYRREHIVGDSSVIQLDANADIPVITHASKREGDASFTMERDQSGSHQGGDLVRGAKERHARASELNMDSTTEVASAFAVQGSSLVPSVHDTPSGEREDRNVAPHETYITHMQGGRVVGAAQHTGGDDEKREREDAATLLLGLGGVWTTSKADHEGSDALSIANTHELGSRPIVFAKGDEPGCSDRDFDATVTLGDPKRTASGNAQAPQVYALHEANGTDVQARATHGNLHFNSGSSVAISECHDSNETKRAETDEARIPIRAGAGTAQGGVVLLGEDRIPEDDRATFHFAPGGLTGSEGGKQHARMDALHTARSNAAPASTAGGFTVHAKPIAHRPGNTPAKALAGTRALPDRLSQPNEQDWRRVEHRMPLGRSECDVERATPVPMGRRGVATPIQQKHAVARATESHFTQHSGRSTPNTLPLRASPMANR